jgi:hypothetical protein
MVNLLIHCSLDYNREILFPKKKKRKKKEKKKKSGEEEGTSGRAGSESVQWLAQI